MRVTVKSVALVVLLVITPGLAFAQAKVGGTKLGDKALSVGKKVGGVVEAIDKTVDE